MIFLDFKVIQGFPPEKCVQNWRRAQNISFNRDVFQILLVRQNSWCVTFWSVISLFL